MSIDPNTASAVLELDQPGFQEEVLKSRVPVLVEFRTPWSQACRMVDAVLSEIATEWAGKARVARVNADDSLDLSVWYDIESVPTLIYYVQGKPALRIVGTASKEAILAKVQAFEVAAKTSATNSPDETDSFNSPCDKV